MACSQAFFLKVCGYVRYCPVRGEVPQLYSSSGGLTRPSAKEAWLLRRAHTRKLFKANWCQYAVYFQEMLLQWEYQEAGVLGSRFQIMNFSAGRNPRSHPVQYCHSTNEGPAVQRHSTIHRSLGSLAAELGTRIPASKSPSNSIPNTCSLPLPHLISMPVALPKYITRASSYPVIHEDC